MSEQSTKRVIVTRDSAGLNPQTEWDQASTIMLNTAVDCRDTIVKALETHPPSFPALWDFIVDNHLQSYLGCAKDIYALLDHLSVTELFMLMEYAGFVTTFLNVDRYSDAIGWVTPTTIQQEWDGDRAKAAICAWAEMREQYHYWVGNVFHFRIEDVRTCPACGQEVVEELDSCGGFYGPDFDANGMADYIPEELHEQARAALEAL